MCSNIAVFCNFWGHPIAFHPSPSISLPANAQFGKPLSAWLARAQSVQNVPRLCLQNDLQVLPATWLQHGLRLLSRATPSKRQLPTTHNYLLTRLTFDGQIDLRDFNSTSRHPQAGAHKKRPPSLGPPYGPRHSPTVMFLKGVVSYERGPPVQGWRARRVFQMVYNYNAYLRASSAATLLQSASRFHLARFDPKPNP